MCGVGKEQSQEQGLGILRHLHQICPTQIIIAYSNADWSLKYQEFFNLADAVMAKSSDYVEFKRTVDKLLRDRFSMGFYVDRVVKLTTPYLGDSRKIQTLVTKAILKKSPTKLDAFLRSHIDDKDTITMVLQITQVATAIASLCL